MPAMPSLISFVASRDRQHPTGLTDLQGRRLVIASELSKGAVWNDALVKRLTGGDKIKARRMHQDNIEFLPTHTLLIAGNDKPALSGVDPAIRARMVIIPFTMQVPPEKLDKDLEEKLKKEAPQILRWLIDGTGSWLQEGLKLPARITEASEAYLDAEDHLKRFLEQRTVRDPKAKTTVPEVFDAYCAWCLKEGLTGPSKRDFTSDMTIHGWNTKVTNKGNTYIGLGLKNI